MSDSVCCHNRLALTSGCFHRLWSLAYVGLQKYRFLFAGFFAQAFYGHIKNWDPGFTQGMCEFTERRIL